MSLQLEKRSISVDRNLPFVFRSAHWIGLVVI